MVDLHIDVYADRTQNGKQHQRLDKSQVARRTICSNGLVNYVIREDGDNALELLREIIGADEAGKDHAIYVISPEKLEDTTSPACMIDYMLQHGLEHKRTWCYRVCFDGEFHCGPVRFLNRQPRRKPASSHVIYHHQSAE